MPSDCEQPSRAAGSDHSEEMGAGRCSDKSNSSERLVRTDVRCLSWQVREDKRELCRKLRPGPLCPPLSPVA